jgi:hypothetical protein
MNLIYTRKRHAQLDTIHRFTILGEFNSSDRDVLKQSFILFFQRIESPELSHSLIIIDFSDFTLKINENRLQECIQEIKNLAISLGVSITIAQSDIESIHAENSVIEKSLQNRINLLENKLELMSNVKKKIGFYFDENTQLKNKINENLKKEMNQKTGARGIFEKLWSDS